MNIFKSGSIRRLKTIDHQQVNVSEVTKEALARFQGSPLRLFVMVTVASMKRHLAAMCLCDLENVTLIADQSLRSDFFSVGRFCRLWQTVIRSEDVRQPGVDEVVVFIYLYLHLGESDKMAPVLVVLLFLNFMFYFGTESLNWLSPVTSSSLTSVYPS
ncbi:hypothetical protein ILYODFUR_021675 [Ilyodon furcidens]|uniref:Uncharacterized protein n=1 Tax=Ilyodon furcidens TaxID=33524 RepID=A0ABV0TYE3_9TELE